MDNLLDGKLGAKLHTLLDVPEPEATILKRGYAFKVGDKVICNGFPGRVAKVCDGVLMGMVEVRLHRGLVCVPARYPDCYPEKELDPDDSL